MLGLAGDGLTIYHARNRPGNSEPGGWDTLAIFVGFSCKFTLGVCPQNVRPIDHHSIVKVIHKIVRLNGRRYLLVTLCGGQLRLLSDLRDPGLDSVKRSGST